MKKKAYSIEILLSINRSIHNFLMSIAKGLTARVLLGNKSEREQQECAKAHLEKLNTLAKTCFQVFLSSYYSGEKEEGVNPYQNSPFYM